MDAKAILLAIFTACLGIVGKIVFDWLSGKKGKHDNGHTTGEKRPEYWLEHLNDIKNMLRDYSSKLESNRETLNRIEAELTRMRGRTGR